MSAYSLTVDYYLSFAMQSSAELIVKGFPSSEVLGSLYSKAQRVC